MKRYAALLLIANIASAQQRAAQPCSTALDECPARGCAAPGTPEAAANIIRRSTTTTRARVTLTIEDFEVLQLAANRVARQGFGIAPRDRARLQQLLTLHGQRIGERSMVRVRAYIVGTPSRRRADSENCNLVGSANNNIRLHLADTPHDTIHDSIIAEVTATHRSPEWTLAKLRMIARDGRLIMMSGQLFYDNKHLVNNDPDAALPEQPARLSLWELHPVTDIMVCTSTTNDCASGDATRWEPLASFH